MASLIERRKHQYVILFLVITVLTTGFRMSTTISIIATIIAVSKKMVEFLAHFTSV